MAVLKRLKRDTESGKITSSDISYKTRRLLEAFDLKKMGFNTAGSRYQSARSSASDWQLCDGRV